MSFRRWVFTLNNYSSSDVDDLQRLPFVYLVAGKEIGDNGTHHLQGFVSFSRSHRLASVKKMIRRAHWEPSRGTNEQASEYCKKDNNYVEYGVLPVVGRSNLFTTICEDVAGGASVGGVAQTFPAIFVRHFRGLRELANTVQEPYNHDDVRGIWIVGKPGTGKSRFARDTYADIYLKAQNKWFDAYNDQETILLDDMDRSGECLGHYLKIWTDRYACTGETKGGTVHLRHKRFVVTSNYSIQALFGSDNEMYKAILRRFIVMNFDITPYRPYIESTSSEEPVEELTPWVTELPDLFPSESSQEHQFNSQLEVQRILDAMIGDKENEWRGED